VIYLIDLKAMKVTGKLTPAGAKGSDSLMYDGVSKRAFINTAASNSVQVVDGATGQLVGTVTLPGRPEAATPDGKGSMFVNIVDKNLVVEYDAKSLAIKNTWPVECDRPYGLAIDKAHRLLFVGCRGKMNTVESDNKMVVMSANNGKLITTVPLGVGTDGIAFDQSTGVVWSTDRDDGSNGKGAVTNVFHQDAPDKYTKLADVKTIYGSRTIALDPKTHHIFTAGTTENEPPPEAGKAMPNGGPRQTMSSLVLEEIGK
jgi:DNA-binding beta-propeller fold protein YncE